MTMAYYFIEAKVDQFLIDCLRERKPPSMLLGRFVWESTSLKARRAAASSSLKGEAVRLCEAAFVARRSNELGATDVVVVRLAGNVNWDSYSAAIDILSRQLVEYGRQRNPKNPILILYTANYLIVPSVLFDPGEEFKSYSATMLVERLRKEELVQFVARTDAMFEFGKAAVFALPSGMFADYFFRVGNLQSDTEFCQTMLFWSLPHLSQTSSIVADTWSISTTSASLGSGLAQYRNGDAKIAWTHLFEYLPTSSESQDRLKRSIAALSGNKDRLLFLNSFRSSGRLEGEVKSAAADLGFADRVDFLSIYGVQGRQDGKSNILCDLAMFFEERGLDGVIEHGTSRSIPVFNIHKRTYFPDFRKPLVKNFSVRLSGQDKDFFERYAGQGIFSVCRTGGTAGYTGAEGFDTKSRHHAFHVDAQRLFGSEEFTTVLRSLKLRTVDAIFTNGSYASALLAEKYVDVSGSLGAKKICGAHAGFLDVAENSDLANFLATAQGETIAFCVPTVVSGAGLGNLQEQLRRILGSPKNIRANVIILIGLLRPDHPDKLNRLKSIYLRRGDPNGVAWHEPIVVESVILPNWQEDRCPWVSERRVITRALIAPDLGDADRDLLLTRKEVLEKSSVSGLSDSRVFFLRDGQKRLRFNPDSLWLDEDRVTRVEDAALILDEVGFLGSRTVSRLTSEADLCCAVASAIQRWRVEASKDPFHFSTIDAAVLTDHNGFNEARLRAAIWRSLTLEERIAAIRSTEKANDFATMCQRIFPLGEWDANYVALELEVALAFRRDLVRVMQGIRGSSVWSSLSLLAQSA